MNLLRKNVKKISKFEENFLDNMVRAVVYLKHIIGGSVYTADLMVFWEVVVIQIKQLYSEVGRIKVNRANSI